MQNVAAVRKRVLAALMDYLIYVLILGAYILIFGNENEGRGYSVEGLAMLPMVFIWFLYFPVAEAMYGQTIAKKLMGIRIVSFNGNDISMGTAVLRRLFDFVDMTLCGIIGIIVMKSSQSNQRVGDHVANTIVVEETQAQCQFCNEHLHLNAHEFSTGTFTCPNCKRLNTRLDFIPH